MSEITGRFIVLVLRPTFERMVMALVAVEANRQEKMRRVFHDHVRLTQNLEIRCGRLVRFEPAEVMILRTN